MDQQIRVSNLGFSTDVVGKWSGCLWALLLFFYCRFEFHLQEVGSYVDWTDYLKMVVRLVLTGWKDIERGRCQ